MTKPGRILTVKLIIKGNNMPNIANKANGQRQKYAEYCQ